MTRKKVCSSCIHWYFRHARQAMKNDGSALIFKVGECRCSESTKFFNRKKEYTIATERCEKYEKGGK